MIEDDGIGRDVLLHPVLPRLVGVPVLVDVLVVAGGDGRGGLVGLSCCSIESHHPVVRLLDSTV